MVIRESSCVGDSWCHATFKVKYCHKMFVIEELRMYVYDLLHQISAGYNMPVEDVGFGDDHVHFDVDTKKIIFAQTRYFSGEIRKNNLRGAQEPQHAPDFSLWVLDNTR